MREIFWVYEGCSFFSSEIFGGDIKEDEKMKESFSLCPALMDERENWNVFNFKWV